MSVGVSMKMRGKRGGFMYINPDATKNNIDYITLTMNNAGGLLPSWAWERLLRIPPVFIYISNNRGLSLEEVWTN